MLGLRTKREKRDKRDGVCAWSASAAMATKVCSLLLLPLLLLELIPCAQASIAVRHRSSVIWVLSTSSKFRFFFPPDSLPFLWSFCFLLPRLAVPEVCKWPQFRSWFLSLGIFKYFRYEMFCRIGCCCFWNDSATLDRSEFINWLYLCACVFLKSGPFFLGEVFCCFLHDKMMMNCQFRMCRYGRKEHYGKICYYVIKTLTGMYMKPNPHLPWMLYCNEIMKRFFVCVSLLLSLASWRGLGGGGGGGLTGFCVSTFELFLSYAIDDQAWYIHLLFLHWEALKHIWDFGPAFPI